MLRKRNETNAETEMSAAQRNRRSDLQPTKPMAGGNEYLLMHLRDLTMENAETGREGNSTGTSDSPGKGRPSPVVQLSLQRELQSIATGTRIITKSIVDNIAI
jgi:hypothetical protein